MDSIQEQMQLADEVSNAISQPLGGDVLDDVRNNFQLITIVRMIWKESWKI
jgi:hypothetical protein